MRLGRVPRGHRRGGRGGASCLPRPGRPAVPDRRTQGCSRSCSGGVPWLRATRSCVRWWLTRCCRRRSR
ncbi:hypothetical protein ACFPRL_30280 [Pseudoclavibacter helvolus]